MQTTQVPFTPQTSTFDSSVVASSQYGHLPFRVVHSDGSQVPHTQHSLEIPLDNVDMAREFSYSMNFEKVEQVDFLYWSAEGIIDSISGNPGKFQYHLTVAANEPTGHKCLINNLDITSQICNEKYNQCVFLGTQTSALQIKVTISPRDGHQPAYAFKQFEYQSDFDKNGIIYYIGTDNGTKEVWRNPYTTGRVGITYSGDFGSPSMSTENIISREHIEATFFGGSSPQSLILDFGLRGVNLTRYTIRHGYKYDNSCLYNWFVAGSNDLVNWTHLDERELSGFTKGFDTKTFGCQNPSDAYYRYITIVQKNLYYMPDGKDGAPFLCINGIELYGSLKFFPPITMLNKLTLVPLSLSSNANSTRFQYESDFDMNGIVYFLGTNGLTTPFEIPSITGDVSLQFSHPEMFNTEMISHNVLGRASGISTFWGGSTPQYFVVDFGAGNSIHPTHYTLRHGYSGANSYIQNWQFEGSLDGVNWTTLHAHKSHVFTQGYGVKTFEIKPVEGFYRYFRVLQLGNYYVFEGEDAPYLCISGFEIYGDVSIQPMNLTPMMRKLVESPLPSRAIEASLTRDYKHVYDFDENGVIFGIGSDDRTVPYSNPFTSGRVKLEFSHPFYDTTMEASTLFNRSHPNPVLYWGGSCPQYVIIDLGEDYKLSCSGYTLKHGFGGANSYLNNWSLEGSVDKQSWQVIHGGGPTPFRKAFDTHTWKFRHTVRFYRYFKLTQHGNYAMGSNDFGENGAPYFCLGGLEFYGKVHNKEVPTTLADGVEREIRRFSYQEDFDTNGLIYFIGTQGKSNTFINPAQTNLVSLSISSDKLYNDQMQRHNVISRDVVEATFWGGNTPVFFTLDLGPKSLFNVHTYTLRHGYSADNSYIYDWQLLGSNDSVTWDVIHFGVDPPFTKGFDIATFHVKRTQRFYRYFRISQKGNYSLGLGKEGGSPCLCINGLELYGDALVMRSSTSLISKYHYGIQQCVELTYTSDLDQKGIMYYLGTKALTQPFQNPVTTGEVKLQPNPGPSENIVFDFGEYRIKPNKYTYTILSQTPVPMNGWTVEASNDSVKWDHLHSSDGKSGKSFSIQGNEGYRYVRVTQVGCIGLLQSELGVPFFDLYGTLTKSSNQTEKPVVVDEQALATIRKNLGTFFYDISFHKKLEEYTNDQTVPVNQRNTAIQLLLDITSSMSIVPANLAQLAGSLKQQKQSSENIASKQEECTIS